MRTGRRANARACLAVGLGGALLGLWVRPYAGIVHDGLIYALQASARRSPESLASDLFFAGRSQDDYTIFSRVYAPLADLLGLSLAAATLTVLALVALCAAAFHLFSASHGGRPALLATLLLAAWPVPYGAGGVFEVVENFATPRGLAVALGLLSVGLWVRGRPGRALAALACAFAVHPLMALPVAGLLLFVRVGLARGITTVLALGALLLCAALAGVPPVAELLTPLDPQWHAIVVERSPFLSPVRWSLDDWALAVLSIAMPAFVGTRLRGLPRRIFFAAAAVGAAGLLATLVGADLLRSALAWQVQPWRALWLSHGFGVAGIGLLTVTAFEERSPEGILAVAGLVAAELAAGIGEPTALGAVAIALWLRARRPATSVARLAAVGVALLSVQVLAWRAAGLPLAWAAQASLSGVRVHPALHDPLVVAFLVAAVAGLSGRLGPSRLRVLLALAVLIAALGVTSDLRRVHRAERFESAGIRERTEVLARLPEGGSIFWGDHPEWGWFDLRYPVYYSPQQTAGVVFSPDVAFEAQRRARHLETALGVSPLSMRGAPHFDASRIRPADLPALCADPALSAVFLPGDSEAPSSVALHVGHGILLGRLAFCERLPR